MSFGSKDKFINRAKDILEEPYEFIVRRNDDHDDDGPKVDIIVRYVREGRWIVRHLPRGPKMNALYNVGFETKVLQAIDDAEDGPE